MREAFIREFEESMMPTDPETQMVEPDITIGGHELTFAQAMTVRVAIATFHLQVQDREYAKGIGRQLAHNYLHHCRVIEQIMLKPRVETVTLTNSERMALADIVLAYLQMPEQPQVFVDVAEQVEMNTEALLKRLVPSGQ